MPGSTSFNKVLSGTRNSETGVFKAFCWSFKQSSLAKKATISSGFKIPRNRWCLVSAFSIKPDLLFQTAIPQSVDSPMALIAASTVSFSVNSTSSGFPTVRSPTTWYKNTDAILIDKPPTSTFDWNWSSYKRVCRKIKRRWKRVMGNFKQEEMNNSWQEFAMKQFQQQSPSNLLAVASIGLDWIGLDWLLCLGFYSKIW